MTEPSDEQERAVGSLRDALEAEAVDEKDFYIREALQLLTLTRSDIEVEQRRSS